MLLDEREDIGDADNIRDQQHQEDNERGADDDADRALTGGHLIDAAGNLRQFIRRERRQARLHFRRLDAHGRELLAHRFLLQEMRDLLTVGGDGVGTADDLIGGHQGGAYRGPRRADEHHQYRKRYAQESATLAEKPHVKPPDNGWADTSPLS